MANRTMQQKALKLRAQKFNAPRPLELRHVTPDYSPARDCETGKIVKFNRSAGKGISRQAILQFAPAGEWTLNPPHESESQRTARLIRERQARRIASR